MSTEIQAKSYLDEPCIISTPGVCGGKPRVDGTLLTVHNLVILHEHNHLSAEEIVVGYPQLRLSQLHAALAYYYLHSAQIEAEIQADHEFVQEMMEKNGPGPLNVKLKKMGS